MTSIMPDNLEEIGTFDNDGLDVLSDETIERLKTGPYYVHHVAWDYCGYVWWSDGLYHEEVWVYGRCVARYDSDALEDVVSDTRHDYGRN